MKQQIIYSDGNIGYINTPDDSIGVHIVGGDQEIIKKIDMSHIDDETFQQMMEESKDKQAVKVKGEYVIRDRPKPKKSDTIREKLDGSNKD